MAEMDQLGSAHNAAIAGLSEYIKAKINLPN